MYEVEQKYAIHDVGSIRRLLIANGTAFRPPVEQSDLYLAHPCRDFRRTDEAFRVRRTGAELRLTYKGPKVDAITKTRREIEVPVLGSWDEIMEMAAALGFVPVHEVVKSRESGVVVWRDLELEVSLDSVRGLGEFIEIEASAQTSDLDAVREKLLSFAESLGLGTSERRGYLDLLMERSPPTDAVSTEN